MKDKEMIEEMAKKIDYAINNECKLNNGKTCGDCEYNNKGDWNCQSLMVANYLYGENYRKIPEDSVVLSKEEQEMKVDAFVETLNAVKLQGSKETAEKILRDFKLWAREYQYKDTIIDDKGERLMTSNEKLNYLYTYLRDKYMNSEKVKEIKKALECCINDCSGKFCPYNKYEKCIDNLQKDALTLINELEKENEILRNAKVVHETVDYCYEDLKKAEIKIAELEKE